MYKIVKYVLDATRAIPTSERKKKALTLADNIKLTQHQRQQLIKAIEREEEQA